MKYNKIKISSNRSFGTVFFIVFFIISVWPILNDENIRIWSLVISVIFLGLGLINSSLLTPLNKIWFKFGIFLGNFISPIVMAIVFFLVLLPTGIIMRILRKDILNLKYSSKSTYWIEKQKYKSTMKNQF
tara:strand:- start:60 stop:449 length:390 start_codon:yes stop_codon:yes gene_type:complete